MVLEGLAHDVYAAFVCQYPVETVLVVFRKMQPDEFWCHYLDTVGGTDGCNFLLSLTF
jgi:hypothetical protein